MKNSRIFKIAHRETRNYKTSSETYAEVFSRFLTKQFKYEREAIADGSIAARIEIQELLIEFASNVKSQKQIVNITLKQYFSKAV